MLMQPATSNGAVTPPIRAPMLRITIIIVATHFQTSESPDDVLLTDDGDCLLTEVVPLAVEVLLEKLFLGGVERCFPQFLQYLAVSTFQVLHVLHFIM